MAQVPGSSVVLTGGQEAWATLGGPGRFWEDKPNAGYSGTPLWKLRAEQQARLQQAEADGGGGPTRVPEGFVKQPGVDGDLYWNEKRHLFWKMSDRRFYVFDDIAQKHVEVHEALSFDLSVSVGGFCHERASQVRNVVVKDLARAAQAMRLPLDHMDQPVAMYALFDGHRSATKGNVCAEFCAKHFHGKLLPRLAAFRGYWVDDRLKTAMRESFEELDASFAEKHPDSTHGCCAAVGLLVGDRLVVASLGDIACCANLHSGETRLLMRAHAIPDPDAEEEDEDDEAHVAPSCGSASVPAGGDSPGVAAARAVPWTRAFGDVDLKGPKHGALALSATPDIMVLRLQQEHHGFAFVCRTLYESIGKATAVSTVFKRVAGRPRMAAGALVDAAVQWLGHVGQDAALGSVVAFLDTRSSSSSTSPAGAPAAKRRKVDEPTQVRPRHILLKHRECKSAVDKVRGKQVTRTRGEAERILRGVLEECVGENGRKIFTQRCRELSECQSCLKAGELAGDLSWVKRGSSKLGEAFENMAFSLQVNQFSDLVDSDQGVHIVLRSA